jgi:hypothetical protein
MASAMFKVSYGTPDGGVWSAYVVGEDGKDVEQYVLELVPGAVINSIAKEADRIDAYTDRVIASILKRLGAVPLSHVEERVRDQVSLRVAEQVDKIRMEYARIEEARLQREVLSSPPEEEVVSKDAREDDGLGPEDEPPVPKKSKRIVRKK